MKALYFIEGGQGRQLCQAIIADELTEKYDDVYVVSHYSWWTEMLAAKNAKLHSVTYDMLSPVFATIMADTKNWDVFKANPYNDNDFILRRAGLFDTCRKLCGLKQKNDVTPNGQTTMPYITVPENIQALAKDFAEKNKKFVMFCRQGGLSVLKNGDNTRQVPMEHGLLRAYPIDKSEKVVEALTKKGYTVLQVALPEEPHVKGAIYLEQEQSMMFYAEISKYAECVITIDSCLMHATINNCKKMIAIWAETDPVGFGYAKAKNLLPHNYHPVAPLLAGIPDTPIIDYVEPDEIISAFDDMMSTKKEK